MQLGWRTCKIKCSDGWPERISEGTESGLRNVDDTDI
jgi:hypothetical protein